MGNNPVRLFEYSFTARYVKHILKWFSKNPDVMIDAKEKGNFWQSLHIHTKKMTNPS